MISNRLSSMATLLVTLVATSTAGQELVPRTYINVPVDMNFIAIGYGHASGNVVLDPALPIEGLDADLDIVFVRYTRTFSLWSKSAKLKLLLPYSFGDWTGVATDPGFAQLFGLEGGLQMRNVSGWGDARLDLEWAFKGAPAVSRAELTKTTSRTIAGASLRLIVPTGQYDEGRLINLGANRWVLRPELGFSRAFGAWSCEGAAAVWLFGDNDEFARNLTLAQDPIYVAKGHLLYTWRPGLWFALGVGYGYGGRTEVDNVPRDTLQRNWRFGVVFAYPFSATQGVSLVLGSMATDGAGPDFDAVTVAYQMGWGG